MTRTNAREIALGCIFEYLATDHDMTDVVSSRIDYLDAGDLGTEADVFKNDMDEFSKAYLQTLTALAVEHHAEIFTIIEEYSTTWAIERISLMSKSILLLALTEILYLNEGDIPIGVSVNEAVNLAKIYDIEKAPSYVNGLLGKYIRETGLTDQ